MIYPQIPKHEMWRSVKYKDAEIVEMKRLFELGMSKSEIAKDLSKRYCATNFGFESRWYQAVSRYCTPEISREQHKKRWQYEKDKPEIIKKMKDRRRKNEFYNRHAYPEKADYHRKQNNENVKTEIGHARVRKWEVKNKEKRQQQSYEWRKANPERIKFLIRRSYYKNIERHKKNPEWVKKRLESSRRSRQKNRIKYNESMRLLNYSDGRICSECSKRIMNNSKNGKCVKCFWKSGGTGGMKKV